MGFFDNIGDFYSGVQENQENLRTNRLRNMTAFSEFKRLNPDASSNDYMSAISAIAGDDEYFRGALPSESAVGKMAQENEKRKKRADEDLAYGDMKRDLEKNEMVSKLIDEESLRGDSFGQVATSVRAKLPAGLLPLFDKDLKSAEKRYDRTRQDEIQRRAKWYFDIVNDSDGNIVLADDELEKYGFSPGIIKAIKAKGAGLRNKAENDTFFKTKTQFDQDIKNAVDMNITPNYGAIASQYPVSSDVQKRLVASVNRDGVDSYIKQKKDDITDERFRSVQAKYNAEVDKYLGRGVPPPYEQIANNSSDDPDVRKKLVTGSNISGDNEVLDQARIKKITSENSSILSSNTLDAEDAIKKIVINLYGDEVASRLLPQLKSAAQNIQNNKAIEQQDKFTKDLIKTAEERRSTTQATQNTLPYSFAVASALLGKGTAKTTLDRGADILVLAAKQTGGNVSEIRGLMDSDPQLKKVFEEASRSKEGAVNFEAAISSHPGANFGKSIVRDANALASLAYPTSFADAESAQRNLEVVRGQVVNIKKLVSSTDKQDQRDALSQLIVLSKVGKENDGRKADSLSVQLLNKEIIELFSDPAVRSLLESQNKPMTESNAQPVGFDPSTDFRPDNSGQSSFGRAFERATTPSKDRQASVAMQPIMVRIKKKFMWSPANTPEVNDYNKKAWNYIKDNQGLIMGEYQKELALGDEDGEWFLEWLEELPLEVANVAVKKSGDKNWENIVGAMGSEN